MERWMETATATAIAIAKIVWINEFTMHKWLTLPIASFVPETSSYIMSNWSIKPNVSQQFDFSFVWINEFTIAAQRIDTQHHQLCARTLSIIITNQSLKTEHIPRQVYFSKNIVHSFVQFGVSQQQSHISDRYFREIQSSIITTNQSMKRELTPPQGLFQTRNVCA